MTHEREKSDSAVVARKPTNNAEQSAAEPVEPRAEAKGNASQQSTCRAQDRESVSQALERIRQAARQRKKEKFTALFHHLTIDLLEHAFDELKKDAAAGVDGLPWKEYDANLVCNLEVLHARLHRGAYREAGECTYRSRMADSARTDSDRDAARMMRWKRSASGSTARK
jgi:hypothetical protein